MLLGHMIIYNGDLSSLGLITSFHSEKHSAFHEALLLNSYCTVIVRELHTDQDRPTEFPFRMERLTFYTSYIGRENIRTKIRVLERMPITLLP